MRSLYRLESESFAIDDGAFVWSRVKRGKTLLGHVDEMPSLDVPKALRPELAALISRYRDGQVDGDAEAQGYFFSTRGVR